MYRKSVLVVSRNLSFSKFIFKRIIFDPAYLQGFSLRKYSKLRAYEEIADALEESVDVIEEIIRNLA